MTEKIQEQAIHTIQKMLEKQDYAIIAIDGRCAAGKTSFSQLLQKKTGGNLIHLDDFFLRPEQRTPDRYQTPGENVDHERFLSEVLQPLQRKQAFMYRPFDCSTMTLGQGIEIQPKNVTIIEGSYALRTDFQPYYDIKIFMTVSPEKQLQRIAARNPEKVEDFRLKWIPFEEKYIAAYKVEMSSDIVIDTSNLF